MRHPTRYLGQDEEVVLEFHPHWCYLGWPLVSVLGAVAVALAVVVSFPKAPSALGYVLLALCAVSVLWLVGRYLRRLASTLVVTSSRVVRRSGVLSRTSLEIRLERINELSCHQTIGGRVLGSGEVLVEVGGETGVVVLDHVPRPQVVQSVISEQVSNWHLRHVAPMSAARPPMRDPQPVAGDTPPTGTQTIAARPFAPDPAERLVKLDQLRRRGLVSDQEYEVKRQQLLREL